MSSSDQLNKGKAPATARMIVEEEEEPPSYNASQNAQQRLSTGGASSSRASSYQADNQRPTSVKSVEKSSKPSYLPSFRTEDTRTKDMHGFPYTQSRLWGFKYNSDELLGAINGKNYRALRRCLEAGVDPSYCFISHPSYVRISGQYFCSIADRAITKLDGTALGMLLDAKADMTGSVKARFIEEQIRVKGANWLKRYGIMADAADSSLPLSSDPGYWAPPLHTACLLDNTVDLIRIMLDHPNGPNIDAPDSAGRTALHLVIRNNNHRLARLLLENGANVNMGNNPGLTALHYATLYSDQNMMDLLFSFAPDVHVTDKHNETALHYAARKSSTSFAASLVDRDAKIDYENEGKQTAFFIAASLYDTTMMGCLLDLGADVDARDKNGCTAMLRAVMAKNESLAAELLRFGSDIDALDMDGCTALDAAMLNDDTRMIDLLIRLGAGAKEMREAGQSVLHRAARRGSTVIIRHLLAFYKVHINVKNPHGQTPLHVAVEAGHLAAVRVLLQNSADVTAEDAAGKTALHLAAGRVQLAIMKELVRHGACWRGDEGNDLLQAQVGTYDPRHRRAVVKFMREQADHISIPAELEKDAYRDGGRSFVPTRSRNFAEINRMREKQGKISIEDELLLTTLEAEGNASASRRPIFAQKDPFEECISKNDRSAGSLPLGNS